MNSRVVARALAASALGACAFALLRELLRRPNPPSPVRSAAPGPAAPVVAEWTSPELLSSARSVTGQVLRVGLYTAGGIVAGACLKLKRSR